MRLQSAERFFLSISSAASSSKFKLFTSLKFISPCLYTAIKFLYIPTGVSPAASRDLEIGQKNSQLNIFNLINRAGIINLIENKVYNVNRKEVQLI